MKPNGPLRSPSSLREAFRLDDASTKNATAPTVTAGTPHEMSVFNVYSINSFISGEPPSPEPPPPARPRSPPPPRALSATRARRARLTSSSPSASPLPVPTRTRRSRQRVVEDASDDYRVHRTHTQFVASSTPRATSRAMRERGRWSTTTRACSMAHGSLGRRTSTNAGARGSERWYANEKAMTSLDGWRNMARARGA
ncbi:hypothetical protein BE221DRAFT_108013 [Ostreococcus tauri]|uniref:Uncharacterized protein n=1 Tax=Ostreococcus tauri TaxID=70448 RepID=A0A1Y5IHG5_OSTTA|nr:hypothetical protein BE221DRAFT_108013 [Ostreococcus tauri]